MIPLPVQRDDGPAVEGLSKILRITLPASVGALAGMLALAAGLGADRGSVGLWTLLGWAVAVVLTSATRAGDRDRLAWLVPPLLRAGEYGTVLVVGAFSAGAAPALAFAMIAATAYHHYESAYRLLSRGVAPPEWVRRCGLGWDGRLLVVIAGAGLGTAAPTLAVLAAAGAVLFVGESAFAWRRTSR